jgi:hypothetical protein
MSAPPADAAKEDVQGPDEEIDLWWGSYAGRTMAPSFAVCIALTALIYGAVRVFVPERGWLQLTFFGLTSIVWLVQLTRWCYRFFTCNYRLTTRYLYVDRGWRPLVSQRFPVSAIDRVEACSSRPATWLGVGEIWVWFADANLPPAVLKGLLAPRRVAETLRGAIRKTRQQKVTSMANGPQHS